MGLVWGSPSAFSVAMPVGVVIGVVLCCPRSGLVWLLAMLLLLVGAWCLFGLGRGLVVSLRGHGPWVGG